MTKRVLPILCTLAAAACGVGSEASDSNLPSCEEDQRDDSYVAGIAKSGSAGYTVTLFDSNPAPPARGDNTWSIEVSDPLGQKLADLRLHLTVHMVDHDHTSPVQPAISDDGGGSYTINPVNLFMPGYWEVAIDLAKPGATAADDVDLDSVLFKFCIEG